VHIILPVELYESLTYYTLAGVLLLLAMVCAMVVYIEKTSNIINLSNRRSHNKSGINRLSERILAMVVGGCWHCWLATFCKVGGVRNQIHAWWMRALWEAPSEEELKCGHRLS